MKRFIVLLLTLFMFACFPAASFAEEASGDTIVYVTRTGSKYHRGSCSYLKSSIEKTLEQAIKAGYSPCSRCKPLRLSGNAVAPAETLRPSYSSSNSSAVIVRQDPSVSITTTKTAASNNFKLSDVFVYLGLLPFALYACLILYGLANWFLELISPKKFFVPHPVYAHQTLWYRNKRTGVVESVFVRNVYDDGFTIIYNGKEHKMTYGDIGVRLYKNQ